MMFRTYFNEVVVLKLQAPMKNVMLWIQNGVECGVGPDIAIFAWLDKK